MTKRDDEHQLPMEQRMELFQAVVETQDAGVDTVVTRRRIAKRFGVTERAVRQIEEEGLMESAEPRSARDCLDVQRLEEKPEGSAFEATCCRRQP
jgi:hypothetical protein